MSPPGEYRVRWLGELLDASIGKRADPTADTLIPARIACEDARFTRR